VEVSGTDTSAGGGVVSTPVLVSVPLHAKMALAHNDETGRRLVLTNWPRTIAWTARLALCGVMLAQVQ
jgi:hypothetical protein